MRPLLLYNLISVVYGLICVAVVCIPFGLGMLSGIKSGLKDETKKEFTDE